MESIYPVDLKPKRKAAGLTQSEFADRLGVAREHYSRIENGAKNISFPLALECARLFGSLKIRQGGVTFILRPDGSVDPDDDPSGGHSQPILNNIQCSDEGVALAVEQEMAEGIKTLRKMMARVNRFASGSDAEYAAELVEQVVEDVRCAVDLLDYRLRRRPEYARAVTGARERQRRKLVERGYRVEQLDAAA